jgi:hypothetical protein
LQDFINHILKLEKYSDKEVRDALSEASVYINNFRAIGNASRGSDYFFESRTRGDLTTFLFCGKQPSRNVIATLNEQTGRAFDVQVQAYLRTVQDDTHTLYSTAGRFDDVFLGKVMTMHPHISKDAFLWYCLNYPSDFGKNVVNRVLNRYKDVLFSKGNYTLQSENKRGREILEQRLFGGTNFENYASNILPYLSIADANAWIGVIKDGEKESDVCIVNFESRQFLGRVLNVDFFYKDSVYYAFSDTKTYLLDERKKYNNYIDSVKQEGEFTDIVLFKTLQKQCRRIGGIAESKEDAPDGVIYDSFFRKGINAILDYVQADLEDKYHAKNNTHPLEVEIVEACTVCEGRGQKVYFCEDKQCDEVQPCKSCNGSKYNHKGLAHGNKVQRHADGITEMTAKFSPREIIAPEMSVIPSERAAQKLQAVWQTFAVQGVFAAQSGLAKQEDSKELEGNISTFGNHIFELIKFIGESYLYAYTGNEAVVKSLQVHPPNPSTYNLQSYTQLLQISKDLAQAQGTSLIVQKNVERKLVQTSGSDAEIKAYGLLEMFKPFNGTRPDVIQSMLAQNLIDKEEAIRYSNADNFVSKLQAKHGSNFEYMDNAILMRELEQMAIEKIKKIQAQDPTDRITDALNALNEE